LSGIEEAYGLESPDDSRRLYAAWASTYDSSFVEATGYVYHQHVAEIFTAGFETSGPVLDVGCGTGVVGVELRQRGVATIDGIDISPEMLVQARDKDLDGPVYRSLILADLTEPVGLDDHTYGGMVSVGAFTHGHLPPSPLSELVRICAPGARGAIGINSVHFETLGFRTWFDAAVDDRIITDYETVTVPIYAGSAPDGGDELATVVVFAVS